VAVAGFEGDLTHDLDGDGIPDISFKVGATLIVEAKSEDVLD
jgi:hypothetical protein